MKPVPDLTLLAAIPGYPQWATPSLALDTLANAGLVTLVEQRDGGGYYQRTAAGDALLNVERPRTWAGRVLAEHDYETRCGAAGKAVGS